MEIKKRHPIFVLSITIKPNKMTIIKTENHIYENLRKFEVEILITDNGNLASIKENGNNIWSIYSHTEKSLRSKVTKWIRSNW